MQLANSRVNIKMLHLQHSNVNKTAKLNWQRRFWESALILTFSRPEKGKNNEDSASNTEHRSRSNSGFRCGFNIRALFETVAVELDLAGKYSFYNLTLLRTKYRLIRCAIGSEVTLFSDAEVALEGHVQARKNLAKFVGQIFITNNPIDDNSRSGWIGVTRVIDRELTPGKVLIEGEGATKAVGVHVVMR